MRSVLLLILTAGMLSAQLSRPPDVPFRIHAIDSGVSEIVAIADINNDGRLDIVSAEEWYEGPTWTPHRFRDLYYNNDYIDAFSNLVLDADGDGFLDVVTVSWMDKNVVSWKNPGRSQRPWTDTEIDSGVPNEFAFLVDLDNDGRALEVLPQTGGRLGSLSWYEARNGAWIAHQVSSNSYGHGIGAGDVNGDGRNDILTPHGWLEAPADPRSGDWKHHFDWDDQGLGFLHVLDINEDGLNDVLTSRGHDYGIFWLEQTPEDGFERHVIDNSWSQAHASTLADINGDGQMDFITGKRYLAHNGGDPGAHDPLGVYWYEYQKRPEQETPEGELPLDEIKWTRHVIDFGGRVGAGVATLPVADIDGDGDLDIVTAGKTGLYLIENLTRNPERVETSDLMGR